MSPANPLTSPLHETPARYYSLGRARRARL